MIELIENGNWELDTMIWFGIYWVMFAFFLRSLKRDHKLAESDPHWFEALITKCFWWGGIAALFSTTVFHYYSLLIFIAGGVVLLWMILLMIFTGGGPRGGWGEDGESY